MAAGDQPAAPGSAWGHPLRVSTVRLPPSPKLVPAERRQVTSWRPAKRAAAGSWPCMSLQHSTQRTDRIATRRRCRRGLPGQGGWCWPRSRRSCAPLGWRRPSCSWAWQRIVIPGEENKEVEHLLLSGLCIFSLYPFSSSFCLAPFLIAI